MELICAFLDPNVTAADDSGIGTAENWGRNNVTYQEANHTPGSSTPQHPAAALHPGWDFYDWNKHVIIPSLCVFGIIGNVLNLVILGKRTKEGH